MTGKHLAELAALAVAGFELAGAGAAVHAIMATRTAQGAIAWAVSLITFPFLALPLYLVFGRSRFQGYIEMLRALRQGQHSGTETAVESVAEYRHEPCAQDTERFRVCERLSWLPFTCGNSLRLLIDGEEAFSAIFQDIREARSAIHLQCYTVRDDQLGRELFSLLKGKAREGVEVRFLFDEIGSIALPDRVVAEMRSAGVDMQGFKPTRGRSNRFQINFRNHRKVIVVDGRVAFGGGMNIGDEYMGRDRRLTPWRDTHLRIEGPAVRCIHASLCADWYWANQQALCANWTSTNWPAGRQKVLVLPTGPTDDHEYCSLFFVHCAHAARRRLWIATPYFVPDEAVVKALILAALRGVDVRIIIPFTNDHVAVHFAAYSYIEELAATDIRLYWYAPGFMHQKVMLIDHDAAVVGTANLDNRSLRLNFEISLLVVDTVFAAQVEKMLQADLATSRPVDLKEYAERGLLFRAAARVARLMAPVL